MKRIALLLSLLLLLTACGRTEPEVPAVYDARVLAANLPEARSYSLAGNGRAAVVMPFTNNGTVELGAVIGGRALYSLVLREEAVDCEPLAELPRDAELLGMDPAGGVWVYDPTLRRIGPEGTETVSFDLPHPLWQNGIFGFGADDRYIYLLCWFRDPEESCLMVYDYEGGPVFSAELTEYCSGTLGYLPREAEWQEELEGREEDRLLTMLFPEGPHDSVILTTLRDGAVELALIRKSPIDSERYVILCAIGTDFSLTPEMYYPVSAEGTIPYGLPMASPEDGYDLLSPQRDALYGVRLEDGSLTPLADWKSLGAVPDWFTGWAKSVCLGPDGRIWSLELDNHGERVRSIGIRSEE